MAEVEGDDPEGEAEGHHDEGHHDPDDGAGLALPAHRLVATDGDLGRAPSDVHTQTLQI